jgi:hypothetical protein
VALLVSGCPAPGYDPNWRSKAERVLVLPLNLVAEMPEELAGGARRVDEILLDYLAERGKSVSTIGFQDAAAAWRAGESDCRSAATKSCDRFDRAAPFAARHLRADHDYDVLIVPYLLLRGARTNGYVASFDGVERPVKMPRYAPYGPYGYGPYGYGPYGYGPYGWGGSRIRAASLKVFGYSPDGKKMFAGIGGLDVVDRIEVSEESGAYTFEVRENVLRDPDAIREGVARALSNFVPRPRS